MYTERKVSTCVYTHLPKVNRPEMTFWFSFLGSHVESRPQKVITLYFWVLCATDLGMNSPFFQPSFFSNTGCFCWVFGFPAKTDPWKEWKWKVPLSIFLHTGGFGAGALCRGLRGQDAAFGGRLRGLRALWRRIRAARHAPRRKNDSWARHGRVRLLK